MKKFFKVLLLAAVALMPVMGMAQTTPSERDVERKFEREMQLRQYTDSVERARLTQLYAHQEEMAHIANKKFSTMRGDLPDIIILLIVAGATLCIVYWGIKNSRRKAEDRKELINKLIDQNLLNSTEPISKEAIEALMKPKKSDRDKIITDATLVGLGLGLGFASQEINARVSEIIEAGAIILLFLGALRLVIRTISMIIAYIINKKKKAKIEIKEAKSIEEAEVV